MTFRVPADKWHLNTGPVKTTRALMESPEGQTHNGVRVKQTSSGMWMVMTEAAAVDMANQILDVIESRARWHETNKTTTNSKATQ